MGFNQKINDSMNNMSRSVTTQMMKDAPPDLTYVYIGPVDEKTRPFCLDAASQGELTKDDILALGGEYAESLVSGGGINCRHNWELASDDITGQFHRGGEAQKIIDAKEQITKTKKIATAALTKKLVPKKEIKSFDVKSQSEFNKSMKSLSELDERFYIATTTFGTAHVKSYDRLSQITKAVVDDLPLGRQGYWQKGKFILFTAEFLSKKGKISKKKKRSTFGGG